MTRKSGLVIVLKNMMQSSKFPSHKLIKYRRNAEKVGVQMKDIKELEAIGE